MRSGHRLLQSSVNGPPLPTFDPTTLALTGYWRGSYAGSPWVGTASAGGSGGENANEAANPPTVGAPLAGKAPASFDGAATLLTPAGTLSTYVGAASAACAGWILLNPAAIIDNGQTGPDNSSLFATTPSSWFDLYLANHPAGTRLAFFHIFDAAADKFVSRAVNLAAWQLITWRISAGVMSIGVNETPGASGGASTTAITTGVNPGGNASAARFGVSRVAANVHYNGLVEEIAFSAANLTDAQFLNVKNNYINPKYGLAL